MSIFETFNKLPRSGLTETMRSMGVANRSGTSPPPPRHPGEFVMPLPLEIPKSTKSELSTGFRQHQWLSAGIQRPIPISGGVNSEIQAILKCGGGAQTTLAGKRQISPIFGCSPPSRTGALNPISQDMKFQLKGAKSCSSLAPVSTESSLSLV